MSEITIAVILDNKIDFAAIMISQNTNTHLFFIISSTSSISNFLVIFSFLSLLILFLRLLHYL